MEKSGDRGRTAFGARMHEARTRAQKTQVQAAKALGVGQSTIVDAERVALGVPWVVAAARLYGVSVEWLALGEGSPDDPYVGSSASTAWPFQFVDAARWAQCSPAERGFIESAMMRALEECEQRRQSKPHRAA